MNDLYVSKATKGRNGNIKKRDINWFYLLTFEKLSVETDRGSLSPNLVGDVSEKRREL